MAKPKQPTFQIQVKATLFYYAKVQANSLEEALAEARRLGHDGLWEVPGDIIDKEYEIEGVSKG